MKSGLRITRLQKKAKPAKGLAYSCAKVQRPF